MTDLPFQYLTCSVGEAYERGKLNTTVHGEIGHLTAHLIPRWNRIKTPTICCQRTISVRETNALQCDTAKEKPLNIHDWTIAQVHYNSTMHEWMMSVRNQEKYVRSTLNKKLWRNVSTLLNLGGQSLVLFDKTQVVLSPRLPKSSFPSSLSCNTRHECTGHEGEEDGIRFLGRSHQLPATTSLSTQSLRSRG